MLFDGTYIVELVTRILPATIAAGTFVWTVLIGLKKLKEAQKLKNEEQLAASIKAFSSNNIAKRLSSLNNLEKNASHIFPELCLLYLCEENLYIKSLLNDIIIQNAYDNTQEALEISNRHIKTFLKNYQNTRGEIFTYPEIKMLLKAHEYIRIDRELANNSSFVFNMNIDNSILIEGLLLSSTLLGCIIDSKVLTELNGIVFIKSDIRKKTFNNMLIRNSLLFENVARLSEFDNTDIKSCTLKRNDFSASYWSNSRLENVSFSRCSFFDLRSFDTVELDGCRFADCPFVFNSKNNKPYISVSMYDCTVETTNVEGPSSDRCKFLGANFKDSIFENCIFKSVSFNGSNFDNVTFIGTKDSGKLWRCDFRGCRFENCTFTNIKLGGCNLNSIRFDSSCTFENVDFGGCSLKRTRFDSIESQIINCSNFDVTYNKYNAEVML